MNYSNITLASGYVGEVRDQCVISQYEMMSKVDKLPIICLWLSLAIFIILAFYWIVLPFLTKYKHYELLKNALPGFAFAISIWLPLILMYFTLEFTESQFKTLESWLLAAVLLLIVGVFINRRKELLALLHKLRDNDN